MTKVPLGIFWDIENCPNLNILRKKSNGIARALRNFIEDKHPECTFPLEFCCAWDTRNKEDISKRLSNNGIDVLYANATSKNAADEKLKEEIDKFIYQHGPNAMVVIITGDINFKRSIQIALQKGLQVILIYGESASQPLLNLVKESYSIDDILETVEDETCEELGQTVILKVYGWPSLIKLDLIHKRLSMLSINCGGKIIDLCAEYALITYVCMDDAHRSMNRMSGMDAFGKRLEVEIYENPIKSTSSNDSVNKTEDKIESNGREKVQIIPDTTKSVITGLFTKRDDNVLQMVRNFVKSWNESGCNPEMIEVVFRNKKFADKDGKAELFVTAVSEIANQKIVNIAKQKFNNLEKHIFWRLFNFNYIKTDYNYDYSSIEILSTISSSTSNSGNNWQQYNDNCKSVIKGLNTRKDENVLFYVRKIVAQWKIDPNIILEVNRSKNFNGKNGKATLFVTSANEEWNKKIVNIARIRFNNSDKNVFWQTFTQHKYENNLSESKSLQSLETFDESSSSSSGSTGDNEDNSNDKPTKEESNDISNDITYDNSDSTKIISKEKLKQKMNKIRLNTKLFASILYDLNPDKSNLKYLYETLISQKEKYISNYFGVYNNSEMDELLYSVNEGLSALLVFYENRYGNNKKTKAFESSSNGSNSNHHLNIEEENRKSIISGVWTDHTDDVLKLVQEEVDSWDDDEICGEDIVDVGRDAKFKFCNGKVLLFVTAKTKEKSKILLRLAEKYFNNVEKDVIWKERVVKWKQSSR